MKKVNYVTNRELLAEIHKSKLTYCSFDQREHADYDAAVQDLAAVTPEFLAGLRAKTGDRPAIVRVMSWDHIPLDPDRKKRGRDGDGHAKLPFKPFKHYRFDGDGLVGEVCRSHWTGNFETGAFAPDRGRITPILATMFVLLVERLSRKGSWRGYSYVEDMRGQALVQLSQAGLLFDESKWSNPFAFYTTIIHNCFTRVLNLEHKSQKIRDELLMMTGAAPSYTRQIDNDLSFQFEDQPQAARATRGRRRASVKEAAGA